VNGKTYFFPIGVTDRIGEAPLMKINDSIEALSAYVREHFPNSQLGNEVDRAGGDWDRKAVLKILDAGLKMVSLDDVVIVYWAGHGESGGGSHRLLLTRDSMMTRELAGWLLECPARHVVCILDCCWSGDGMGDLAAEAEEIRKQQAQTEYEHQTTTVIVSARAEPAQEGAFVAAMMEVLTNGPGPGVGESHRWNQNTVKVAPFELVEAVSTRFRDQTLQQRAFHGNLRQSDLGRFFPSIWHARCRPAGDMVVDAQSRARAKTEAAFRDLRVSPPTSWTQKTLDAHRAVVDCSLTLVEEDRAFLSDMLHSLALALSAEALASSMVDRTAFTDDALRSARRAATGQFDDPPIGRQFDLFHDAATRRGQEYSVTPIEALVRFVARLAYECNADPRDSKLFDWAVTRGLESNDVNRILEEVTVPAPVRRLVIDLRNNRLPDGDFPDFASAQIFENSVAKGERTEVAVSPANVAGALGAIAALVKDKLRDKFQLVDVIVPDELILLDPGIAPVHVPRRVVQLGSKFLVSLRIGGRFHPSTDWQKCVDIYRSLTRSPCPIRCITDGEPCDELYDELQEKPCVVVFETVPASTESGASSALLDAVYACPIVIWPAFEVDGGCLLKDMIDAHWPTLRHLVKTARWEKSCTLPNKELLCRLRMVWEDDQWLKLASKMESYG
jgi:hypothetical protein